MSYQQLLLGELKHRQDRNQSYSMRRFARSLRLSPALVSQLIRGKVPLTKKSATRIADQLGLKPTQRNELLKGLASKGSRPTKLAPLSDREFEMISEWHHYGILGLAGLRGNKSDPRWVAKRLGISVSEARRSIGTLKEMGILQERKGTLVQTTGPLTTTRDVSSYALRKYHRQNLYRAETAMDELPVSERYLSAVTLAMSEKDYEAVKEAIVRFRRRLMRLVDGSKAKDSVYQVCIQFFPVDKRDTREGR